MNKQAGTVWRDVLALGRGKVDRGKLAQIELALEQVLEAHAIALDPNEVRLCVSSQFREWGLSAGAVHALDQAFMGLVRRAALAGLLPPPPEGPWNSPWQHLIDLAPHGNKAVLKALAGWCFRKGAAPSQATEALLSQWQRERHMTASDLRTLTSLLPELIRAADRTQENNPLLLARLEARSRTGMTRSLSEQYGVRGSARRMSAEADSDRSST